MSETDDFLATMGPRIHEADFALHQGDPTGRLALWSRTQPLTLFGAAMSGSGWSQIEPVFERLGEQFTGCTSFENEIIAADARGDLAYTVALEHTTAGMDGAEPTSYVLRVTTVFRREDGDWKVVHRHADALSGAETLSRLSPPER